MYRMATLDVEGFHTEPAPIGPLEDRRNSDCGKRFGGSTKFTSMDRLFVSFESVIRIRLRNPPARLIGCCSTLVGSVIVQRSNQRVPDALPQPPWSIASGFGRSGVERSESRDIALHSY